VFTARVVIGLPVGGLKLIRIKGSGKICVLLKIFWPEISPYMKEKIYLNRAKVIDLFCNLFMRH
jgi:hypothetical protein